MLLFLLLSTAATVTAVTVAIAVTAGGIVKVLILQGETIERGRREVSYRSRNLYHFYRVEILWGTCCIRSFQQHSASRSL